MIVIAPILIPMLAAAGCLLVWRQRVVQAGFAISASVIALAAGVGIVVFSEQRGPIPLEVGGWAAPYGITLVGDLFAGIMVCLGAIVSLSVCVFALGDRDREQNSAGFFPLVLCLLAAVSGAFLSGDIFNLYVWFELMLLSSFVLLTLGGTKAQIEGAIKYVTLNLLSSVLFLAGIGLLYAATGTLNMAHLSVRLDALDDPEFATLLAAPLLIAFGIKAAVFPLFFWLPASYHTPRPVTSALFAGLLTKVGVYSMIRTTTLIFDQEREIIADAMLIVAGLTMLSGVLGAVAQSDMRRILSFHIVSQIGYMLMGLGIALRFWDTNPEAAAMGMTGAVFYILHHIVVKTNLFLVSGAVLDARGATNLSDMRGVISTHPLLSGLFLFSALSLAGIPILSGFWAKLTLVRAGIDASSYPIVIVSLVVSILTLFSMMKIWTKGFWGEPPEDAISRRVSSWVLGTITGMAVISAAVGLFGSYAYRLAERASEDLMQPERYVDAVLPPSIPEDAELRPASDIPPDDQDGGER